MILTDAATIKSNTASGVWGRADLGSIFSRTAKSHPDRLAVADAPNRSDIMAGRTRRLTYAELDRVAGRLARTFHDVGLIEGDVVAMQLPNTVEQVAVFLACARLGLILSPVPLMWREYELTGALPLISPKALISITDIVGRNHADMMRYAAVEMVSVRFVMAFGEDVPDGVIPLDGIFDDDDQDAGMPEPTPPDANKVMTICWSGGSHPQPCPVPRSHNQWIAAGLMSLLEGKLPQAARVLSPYPFTGLVPIGVFFVPWLLSGGTLCLHHPFDMDVFMRQLAENEIQFTGLPPAVLDALRSEGAFGSAGAGASLVSLGCLWPSPYLPEDAHERAVDLKTPVVDIRAFGEMAYVARKRVANERPCLIRHGETTAPSGSEAGPVLLSTRVRGGAVSNNQQSSLLAGDLMIRSPMMFDCFFPSAVPGSDDPTLERDSQGYVNTGLRCQFVGAGKPSLDCVRREGSVIYHGGMSISAAELDRLYAGHDQLSDAAAFTFDDPVMGERIIAALVPSPGMTVTFEDLAGYLRERKVAAYKVPDRVITVKMIPRDERGEVLRDQVLDQI